MNIIIITVNAWKSGRGKYIITIHNPLPTLDTRPGISESETVPTGSFSASTFGLYEKIGIEITQQIMYNLMKMVSHKVLHLSLHRRAGI